MPAMTSIAVTASICASTSEAALLVASFMPFSLDLGVTHRCARARERRPCFTRNTPRRVFALIESPLSEYRPCQGRTVMRRHFDSRVTRLANLPLTKSPTKKSSRSTARLICEAAQAVDQASSAGYCFEWKLLFDKAACNKIENPGDEPWPVSTTAIP